MFNQLPDTSEAVRQWTWENYAPYATDLMERPLTTDHIDTWLKDWTKLVSLIFEVYTTLNVETSCDTTDEALKAEKDTFVQNVIPPLMQTNHLLNQKLMDSGLTPENFDIPFKKIQADMEIFSEKNLPLIPEEQKLEDEYDRIIGAQTVEWDGEERTLKAMDKILDDSDRAVREKAWRAIHDREIQDREALNQLWTKFVNLRQELAANAGQPDYRTYMWKDKYRFDYTPEDCDTFHRAIEEKVVPLAVSIYERRKQRLGLDSLRPWDLNVPVFGTEPLRPFESIDEFTEKAEAIFRQVHPDLGVYFKIMRDKKLLDLDNRKGKAPGGYNTMFIVKKLPFIFMNAVGRHQNVQTLLHEGGHAFHGFEAAGQDWPYFQQFRSPMEFNEVASMTMEFMGGEYLNGTYYNEEATARARIEHLEKTVLFWPYMAVVDAFQHHLYAHIEDAKDPANCDTWWTALWNRFMKGVDYSGLDAWVATGWHRKLHIFQVPFYYVEYGLAQMGAVQVWQNYLKDKNQAVVNYRKALSLAGTAPLPKLFQTAGAKFAFDGAMLGRLTDFLEEQLDRLEGQLSS